MTEETQREAMTDPENDQENPPVDDAGETAEAAAADDPPEARRVTPEEVEEALAEAEMGGNLDALQAEFDDLNDRHLRLAAEFSNFRRRAESEAKAVWGRAQADLVRRFLDVLDDLERVALLDPEDEAVTVQSIVDGIDLVERKFIRALQDSGAEVVNPEAGAVFDPETMEAMMRVPAEDEAQDDCVAQVFLKGYVVDGNLVRPARVSVFKAD